MTAGAAPDDSQEQTAGQSSPVKPGLAARVAARAALFAACAALLFAGGYYRFRLITTEGIREGDTVGYYTLATRWASGDRSDFLGETFYRPVVYFISELAIRWFGDNDYSIKAVNGAFDVANILLILLIARHLSGSLLPGLAAGTLYALLPYEIEMCRSGMPHAISGTFVLLSLFLFLPRSRVLAPDPLRLLYDAAAGLALGLAMNTHAELGFIGVGFVACQAIQVFSAKRGGRAFAWFVLRAAVITLATLAPYGIGILVFGYEKVYRILSSEIGRSAFSPVYVTPAPLYRVPLDVLSVSSYQIYGARGWIPLFVAIPPLAWCVHRAIARGRRPFTAFVPWALVLSYMLVFPVLIGPFDWTHARIFLPIFPLTLLGAACAVHGLFRERNAASAGAALMSITGLVLTLGPNAMKGGGYFESELFRPSIYRSAHDVIGQRVNASHRVLILPSTAYLDSGFKLPLYFGEHATYLAELPRTEPYTPELLKRVMDANKASYFLLSGRRDLRMVDPNWASMMTVPPWIHGPSYDLAIEDAAISNALATTRAHLLARLDGGDLFSRRKRTVFPNSMFERGNLEGWHAIGFAPMFALSPTGSDFEVSEFCIDTRRKIKYPDAPPADASTSGELFCEPFTIGEDLIGMVIAGTDDPVSIHVGLRVAGSELRMVPNGPELSHTQWDVSAYRGERAQFVIRDLNPGIAEGISVAGFYYVF